MAVAENSLANLIRPKPGEVRNPKGRGKGRLNTKNIIERWLSVRELLTDEYGALIIDPKTGNSKQVTQLDLMVLGLIRRSKKGDVYAFNSLLDRYEGKPLQATEITGGEGGPVVLKLIPARDCEPLNDE